MENINLSGSELCFVVFPMALKYLPFSNLWAILFFLMMLLLGIDTMFAQFGNNYKILNILLNSIFI
jgi:SNF family Na+-dependent transporter